MDQPNLWLNPYIWALVGGFGALIGIVVITLLCRGVRRLWKWWRVPIPPSQEAQAILDAMDTLPCRAIHDRTYRKIQMGYITIYINEKWVYLSGDSVAAMRWLEDEDGLSQYDRRIIAKKALRIWMALHTARPSTGYDRVKTLIQTGWQTPECDTYWQAGKVYGV